MKLTWRVGCIGAKRTLLVLAAILGTPGVFAEEVIPDFYQDPGLYPNRSYINQSANEHIDPFTGSLQYHYVDLYLPGNGGFDLKVVRSYNSASVNPLNPGVYESLAGLGWTVHFGRVLKANTNICVNLNAFSTADNPVLEMPDGSRQLLVFTGSTAPLMLTTQRWRADCHSSGNGLTVYSPDGTRYDMSKLVSLGGLVPEYAWYTTKITDRNDNYATINYAAGSSPEITSISTNDGRSINFTYADSGMLSRRITGIIGSSGQAYYYNYQAAPGVGGKYFLTSVNRPDGTSWRYEYNGNFLGATAGGYVMNRATDPHGGSITYSYSFVYFDQANPSNFFTAVTRKSSSSGGNWSFRHTPGSLNNYDTTIVNTPAGTITYRHIGPNYSNSGALWMVGLLMSKQIGTQTETYLWDKQQISSENYIRPGAYFLKLDLGTHAPILINKQISRDGTNYITSYSSFDSYGNPGSMLEYGPNGGSRSTSLSYYINTSKWIVKQKVQYESSPGGLVSRSFDFNGNLTSITRDGVTTSYSYSQGNVTSATFPRSLNHTYSNYRHGIPQSESQPEGVSISRVVSSAGNVTSETNGEGRTISYGYDGLNRITSIGYPAGNSVSISYGTNSKTASRGSLIESTSYDGFGRPISVTLGGISRTYQHDALGRKIFESHPGSGSGISYQYDILDRVTRISNSDGTSKTISYGLGRVTVTNERGATTTYSYRSYGDPAQQFLMSVSAPEGSISISRNARDIITSVTQGGFTRNYGYNSNYYLVSVTAPETGTTTYGRDAAGNMTSRSIGASGTTSYTYDGQNRLTAVTYPGSTPSVSQTYSKTHKLLTVTSSAASRRYNYDANDNLTSESLTVDGIPLTTSYSYNGNDLLSSITYPRSGRVVNYAPDVLGRPTQVSGYAASVSYWPSGQVNQINYANGTITKYGQNSRLWPSSFSTQAAALYINSSYSYDAVGNLTGISDSVDSSYNRTLGYDAIDRLTSISGPWGSGTIAYNGVGNIASQVLGLSSLYYNYDGSNKLSSVSGARAATYGYDAYGSVVSATGNTYTYDGVPNLRCVNCNDAANKIEYTYDGLNQRVSVTKAGVKTYEVYGSHGNLLVEYTPSQANKLIEYIYLGGKRIAQRQSDEAISTTTTLTATPNPAGVNQQVALKAIVTGNSPTGTVTFKDGATTLGSASVSAGQATFTATFTTAGSHSLTASYGGDANNIASTSTLVTLTVNAQAISSTTLTATPNPAGVNRQVALKAIVTGNSPTGTVTFKDGATTLGSASVSDDQATFTATFTTTGSHSLTASYGGDANNVPSDSAAVVLNVVALANTTTTLTSTGNPARQGYPITLTATVSGSTPTGTVTFKDGTSTLRTVTLSAGKATLQTSTLALGTHSLTASYSGDIANNPSVSGILSQVINTGSGTTTTLTTGANPAVVGAFNQIIATISGGVSPRSGTITFKDGGVTLATSPVQSISLGPSNSFYGAIFNTNVLAVGSHSITAVYSGDVSNAQSTSAVLSQTINP